MRKLLFAIGLLLIPGLCYASSNLVTDQASDISTDTTNFNKNLSSADTTVQKALETLDNMAGGGSSDHASLSHLAYADSGHTGFQPAGSYLTSLSGAVLTDQSTPQTIGATGARLTKLWATDITCTNAIAGSITGNAATVTVANEASDTTCFPLFAVDATGSLEPKTVSTLTLDSSTGKLGASILSASNTSNQIVLAGTNPYTTTLTATAGSSSKTITFPNTTGTVALTNASSLTSLTSIASSTGAITVQIGYGATTNGVTKAVNIGKGGAAGSITNISFGSTAGGTFTVDSPNIVLNSTSNIINALTASKVVFTDASKNLTSTGIGTSAQFIKGDGSLDSSAYLTSLSGAVFTDQSTPQTIGATGARLTKLWATDITCTNAITGSITGNAGTVTGFSPTSGKTLTQQKSMTFTASDDTGVYTFPTGTKTLLATDGSAASLTNFPTLNQNTTGSAAKWTTARNLAGNSVDGSGNVAFSNKFIAQGTSDSGLSGAQFLGALSTGLVKNTTSTGVLSIAAAGTDYVAPNASISGATKTKITYDAKGLVTSGADATTADIADSSDKRYCTDSQKTVIQNTSGTNSGNETATTIGTLINGATEKNTPSDADMLGLMDSDSSNVLRKLSWSYTKASLKTYLDSYYRSVTGSSEPCTITIASSTSRNKQYADFICDATDDNVQVQDAIDLIYSLSSAGAVQGGAGGKGSIVFLEGTYIFGSTVYMKPGIHFQGQDLASTVIKAKTNFNSNLFAFNEPTVNPSAGVHFKQLYFDGNKGNNTSGTAINTKVGAIALWDLQISNSYFFDFDGTVLDIKDPWGLRIFNSHIEDCPGTAISIVAGSSKTTGAVIENCKIIQCGTGTSNDSIILNGVEGCRVIGNEINTYSSGKGIQITNGGGHLIVGNRFGASINGGEIGITTSNFNTINGNFFIGGVTGLTINSGTNNIVSNNGFSAITNSEISDSGTNTVRQGNRGDDANTNMDVIPNVQADVLNGINDFRLTLTSATPVTTSDTTGSTIYLTPYKGNRICLYDGAHWKLMKTAQVSLGLTMTAANNYDVFAYDNAGTVTLEILIWTNGTTRATALAYQDGVLVKSGATTRRYLGTIRASATNTAADTALQRYVWNYYNRVPRYMACTDTTDTWNYTTATWRQANGAAGNKVEFVVGVAEDEVTARSFSLPSNASNIAAYGGIGLDATNANSAQLYGGNTAAIPLQCWSQYDGIIGVGYHYLAWLEISTATGTTTWYGDAGATVKCGLNARILA